MTKIVTGCPIRPEQIDVCSSQVEFDGVGRDEKNSFTGYLSQFLKNRLALDYVYDVVVLDFSGSWSKENRKCVEMIFRKKLIDTLGIFVVTLA